MRGRVFDTLAGRFATPDPIMQAPYWSQGLNRYAYVFNNPINLVDPSGFAVGDAGFTVNGVAFNNGTYYEFGGTSLGGSSTGFSALGAAGSIATGVGNIAGTLSMGSQGGTFHVGHPAPSAAPASNVAAKGTSAVQQAKGQAGPPPARRNWQPGDIGPPPPPRPDWMNAPHGAQAPSVANRILNDPAFQIPDTSEDLQLMMEIIMAAAPVGPKGIGLAKRALPVAKAAASAINITEKGLAHVLARHVSGGTQAAGKSLFSGGAQQVRDLIEAAVRVTPVQQAGGNFARVVDAGRSIGIDRATGAATSRYTVITNSAGELVTAFPGIP